MKKILNNKNFKFGIALALVIIVMISLALYVADIKHTFYTKGVQQNANDSLVVTNCNTEITQSFTAVADNLEKVILQFEQLDNQSGGNLVIGIRDQNGNVIKEQEVTRNYIRGNQSFVFKFPKQNESKNQKYELYFKYTDLGEYEQFLVLKLTNKNEHADKLMKKNGEVVNEESIIFTDMYESNARKVIFIVIMGLMIITISIVAWIIFIKKSMKIENIFLLCALSTYIFSFVAMPTFKNHDEYYHWIRAY